jgi:hypothetical protein
MSARRRRLAVAAASLALVALGAACVDLFHSTDFVTLCATSPSDPACGATDGAVPDVVVRGGDDARVDADAGPSRPDFCAWTSTEARTQATRACAWLGACERPLGESLFGSCVVHAQLAFDCTLNPAFRPRGAVDTFWACLATVTSCGDVDRCVFPAGVNECIGIEAGTSTACGTASNANVRLECMGAAGRAHGVEPCLVGGQTCSVNGDKSIAKCSGLMGFACSGTGGSCDGTSAVDCRPLGVLSLDQGVDCSGYSTGECVVGDAGAACVPSVLSNTCVKDSLPTCQGSVVQMCVNGAEARVDCSLLGLPCDTTNVSAANPTAACVKQGAGACTDADVCPTSTTLRSCGRGVPYTVDCTSVGLGKCVVGSDGRGACTPP